MPITSTQYPVNLILVGRPCLVVGGGAVAARKAQGLLACAAAVRVVATDVGPQVRALVAKESESGRGPDNRAEAPGVGTGAAEPPARFLKGSLAWEQRPYAWGEVAGYRLVIAATDDHRLNRAVAADAEAAGVWVNVADDPAACGFTLPAVARQGPVSVAVSTAGHSPALAGWLRDRLAEVVGPEYSALARLLSDAREELRVQGRTTEGLDWQSILDSDMLGDIRDGRVGQARERLRACLSLS